MVKLLLTGILFLMAASTGNAQLDCQKFRNGEFVYPRLPGKESHRKDSIQESFNEGKLEMQWKVKWLSECEYEIVCTKMLIDDYPIKVGDRIVAKIIGTEGPCFRYESTFYSKGSSEGQKIPEGKMCIKQEDPKKTTRILRPSKRVKMDS